MSSNEELSNKLKNNSKENIEAVFDKYFDKEINSLFKSNFNFFKKINNNDNLRSRLKSLLLDVYEEQN